MILTGRDSNIKALKRIVNFANTIINVAKLSISNSFTSLPTLKCHCDSFFFFLTGIHVIKFCLRVTKSTTLPAVNSSLSSIFRKLMIHIVLGENLLTCWVSHYLLSKHISEDSGRKEQQKHLHYYITRKWSFFFCSQGLDRFMKVVYKIGCDVVQHWMAWHGVPAD